METKQRSDSMKNILKQRSGILQNSVTILATDFPIFVEFAQKKNLILDETESQLLWGC